MAWSIQLSGGDKIPKEGLHYSYIAAIIIDSVIRIPSSILRKTQI